MKIPSLISAAAALLLTAQIAQARPYIIGADISWLPQDEASGANYWDKGVQKDLLQILKEYKFNFIRLRIFVNPAASGGYSRQGYCDLENTKKMAKRIQAAGMNFLLDFHMSDTWASIGEQHVPSSWAGKTDAQMQDSAYAHVHRSLQALIAQGTRPDWVQVGNEINSCMSGVCTSNWPRFAALVNAGVKGVRDADPTIKVVMQHGRPREDGNFMAWVDGMLNNKVDFDIIGGSTYGTTNEGADWRDQFGKTITKTKRPVVSLEYTPLRTALVNDVMFDLPDQMGMGGFLWEPTRYPEDGDGPMFDRSGQKYTTNKYIEPYIKLAQDYQATMYYPVVVGVSPAEKARAAGYSLQAREGRFSFVAPKSGAVRLSIHTFGGKRLGEWTIQAHAGNNLLDAKMVQPLLREFGPKVITLRGENGAVTHLRWAGGIPSGSVTSTRTIQ